MPCQLLILQPHLKMLGLPSGALLSALTDIPMLRVTGADDMLPQEADR